MAKRKDEIIESEVIETEEIFEEEITEEPIKEEADKSEQFLYTQLKTINKLTDTAKAKRLSARVQNNYRKR